VVKKLFEVIKNRSKYSAEDFTQDEKFINWVKNGADEGFWDDFIRKNPPSSPQIETAKQILQSLRFQQTTIDDEHVAEVYRRIETHYEQHTKRLKTIRLVRVLQYAAAVAVLAVIGIGVQWYASKHVAVEPIAFQEPAGDEATLTLPGGEEIKLARKHSELQISNAGDRVVINNDSVVSTSAPAGQTAMAQLVVPYGKRSDIVLSDGTKVWLNAGSKLVFPQKFTGNNRKVYLKGEALFAVAKNKEMPFIVNSDNINITVLGTEFNVRNIDLENKLEIVLVEGEVSVKEKNTLDFLKKEFRLKPNQKATYDKGSRQTVVESNVNVGYYTSWRFGLLEFNRESILNVFDRLSKYYNVEFVSEKGVELSQKISGKLDLKESLNDVMTVVSDVAPVVFRIEDEKVYVSSKQKK
jgi:ferric-dicitrate binding protein FerR (iron transport regulator)